MDLLRLSLPTALAASLCTMGCYGNTSVRPVTPWLRIVDSSSEFMFNFGHGGRTVVCRVERDTPSGGMATVKKGPYVNGTVCRAAPLGNDRALVLLDEKSFAILSRDDTRRVVLQKRGEIVSSPDAQKIYDVARQVHDASIAPLLVEVRVYSNTGQPLEAWSVPLPPPTEGYYGCASLGCFTPMFTRRGDVIFIDSESKDPTHTVCRLLAPQNLDGTNIRRYEIIARVVPGERQRCTDVDTWPMFPLLPFESERTLW